LPQKFVKGRVENQERQCNRFRLINIWQ
jgi:hypothetical protein